MRQLQTSRANAGSSNIFGGGSDDAAPPRKPLPQQQQPQQQDNIFHTDRCAPRGGGDGMAAAYHGGQPSLGLGENHDPVAAFGLQLRSPGMQNASPGKAAPTSARALRARRNQVSPYRSFQALSAV